MQLLKLAERVGARFVYVSTTEASVATLHRGTLADAEGKRFGEALCIAAQTELGIDARIVRVPECYGPRMPLDSEHVIPVLLRASNTRGQPALRAAPFERRELTYVEDVVSGIEAAAEARSEQAAPVTLLESAGSATVKEIVETFARVAQRGKEPVYLPTDDEGYVASQALAAYPVKAAADLGWRPQTALEAGLALTYQWYRSAGKRYAPV
jgi:nucleoside-diphosphate-sugar epimerase